MTCQDVSLAGKRSGLKPDTRSGLWNHMAYAISKLRPRYVVAENVRGLLSAEAHSDVEPCPWCLGDGPGEPALRALGAVLGDLADLGYDAQWCGLRAADVGAPHGRFRVFVLAEDAYLATSGQWRLAAPGQTKSGGAWADAGGRDRAPTADTDDTGRQQHRRPVTVRPELAAFERGGDLAADTDSDAVREQPVAESRCGCASIAGLAGHATPDAASDRRDERRPEPARELGGPDAAERRAASPDSDRDGLTQLRRQQPVEHDSDRRHSSDTAWGPYEPAIRRWERILGRTAPAPTESGRNGQRLSPRFVEFMMGLPAGHVTAVPGVNRNAQLKALGNGVVPQQAIAALRHMYATGSRGVA